MGIAVRRANKVLGRIARFLETDVKTVLRVILVFGMLWTAGGIVVIVYIKTPAAWTGGLTMIIGGWLAPIIGAYGIKWFERAK